MKRKNALIIFLFLSNLCFALNGAKYLIIAPDSFVTAIQPLANWKTKKGVLTKIVPLSVTGTTASQIKSYILNAYTNWDIKPDYVLLAGLSPVIPSSGSSDDYYADMTGNYRIELSIGRLPCTNVNQCNNIVAKTLMYERTPYIIDTTWFAKRTTIIREDGSSPPDDVYWENARYIHALWRNVENLQIDSFSSARGNNSTNINNAINSGRAFVVFRGQSVANWWSPFAMTPANLTNGSKTPVVVSGTCQTASISDNSYLGNLFINAGSATTPKGAVGFFATTVVASGSGLAALRGTVTKGFFKAVFDEGKLSMGDAAKRAKFIIDSVQPPNYNSTRYSEWQLLGDPELHLWTGRPNQLTVSHDTVIEARPQIYTVTVTRAGSPFAGALVCIMRDTTIYQYNFTNSSGTVSFSISPTSVGTMSVTVTGVKNCLPYERDVRIIPIPDNDVGVDAIIYPLLQHQVNIPMAPVARVKNYGSSTQTNFPVICSIVGSGGVLRYTNTQNVTTLSTGDTTRVNFATWIPNIVEMCTVKMRTSLVNDQNLLNDRKTVTNQINPTINIISPNGNERWGGSSNQIIKWRTIGTGFARYRLLFSRNSGATYIDTIVNNIVPTETTYNWVVPLINYTTCRVAIQVLDGSGTVIVQDASDADFIIDSQTPSVPILILPTNNFYTHDSLPRFWWHQSTDSLSGINNYQLQYATNSGFIGCTTINISDTTYQVPTRLADTTYYWHVKAIDRAGNQGNWSLTWSFEIDTRAPQEPGLVAPINGIWLTNTLVIFNWSQVTFDAKSPVRYLLQIDTTVNFTNSILDTTSLTYDTLVLNQARYYWRVRAYDLAGNQGAFSGYDSFGVDISGPTMPVLVSPVNGAILADSFITFIWQRSSDNLSGVNIYRIQIANNPNFTNPIDTLIADTSIIRKFREPIYWWRVKAIDWVGNQSVFSNQDSFIIDITAPGVPTLVSPTNGVITNNPNITFIWHHALDSLSSSQRYTLEYTQNAGFINSRDTIVSDSSITIILADTTYYWHVKSEDSVGNQSVWSATFNFELDTRIPETPLLSSPINGIWLTSTSIIFNWSPVCRNTESPVYYILLVDTNNNFTNPIIDTTNLNYDTLVLNQARYYWRIRAYDLAGNQSPISGQDSFGVDITPPSTPNLIAPTNNTITNNSNVTFVWSHATDNISGIFRYALQTATNSDFVNPQDTVISDTIIILTLTDTTYYWHVCAFDLAGNRGVYSDTFNFIADTTRPSTPTLIYPPNNASVRDTFIWHRSSDNLSGVKGYHIQIGYDSSFTSIAVETTLVSANDTVFNFTLPDSAYYWHIQSIDNATNYSIWSETRRRLQVGILEPEAPANLPLTYILCANQPNPFRQSTEIRYGLPSKQRIRIIVYSASGQSVATVLNGIQNQGWYSVSWNGTDNKGRFCPNGIYFYRLETDKYQTTRKMLMLK